MSDLEFDIPTHDVLVPFLLESSPVRGRIVRLQESLDAILTRHAYPELVARLLGELLTIGSLLSVHLKHEGILTLQVRGDLGSPITLLVVDVTSAGNMRGYAQFDAAKIEGLSVRPMPSLSTLMGNGYFAITLDQPGTEQPYQGIVDLSAPTLVQAVQDYFTQSQQIDVRFHVAVGTLSTPNAPTRWIGAGLMMERIADIAMEQEALAEAWWNATILLATLNDDELLDETLALPVILYRLFHEGGVRMFPAKALQFQCRCTPERMENLLMQLPLDDVRAHAVDGIISIRCEFCNSGVDVPLATVERVHTGL